MQLAGRPRPDSDFRFPHSKSEYQQALNLPLHRQIFCTVIRTETWLIGILFCPPPVLQLCTQYLLRHPERKIISSTISAKGTIPAACNGAQRRTHQLLRLRRLLRCDVLSVPRHPDCRIRGSQFPHPLPSGVLARVERSGRESCRRLLGSRGLFIAHPTVPRVIHDPSSQLWLRVEHSKHLSILPCDARNMDGATNTPCVCNHVWGR